MANRTLVLIDADGTVEWAYESPSPGEFARRRRDFRRPGHGLT